VHVWSGGPTTTRLNRDNEYNVTIHVSVTDAVELKCQFFANSELQLRARL